MAIKMVTFRLSAHTRMVLMVAKELKIEIEQIPFDLNSPLDAAPDFAKKNPTRGQSPIDDNGYVLWESRAVVTYLCNKYAPNNQIYPSDPVKRSVVDRWLMADLQLLIAQRDVVFEKHLSGNEPSEHKVQILKDQLKGVDTLIGDNKYLNGNNLTIADLSLLTTTQDLFLFDYDLTDYPNFRRYHSTLRAEIPYFDEINHFEKDEPKALIEKLKSWRARFGH